MSCGFRRIRTNSVGSDPALIRLNPQPISSSLSKTNRIASNPFFRRISRHRIQQQTAVRNDAVAWLNAVFENDVIFEQAAGFHGLASKTPLGLFDKDEALVVL